MSQVQELFETAEDQGSAYRVLPVLLQSIWGEYLREQIKNMTKKWKKDLTKQRVCGKLLASQMRKWRNWQTRTFEGRVVHTVRVQVPFLAPSKAAVWLLYLYHKHLRMCAEVIPPRNADRQFHMRMWRNWQTR